MKTTNEVKKRAQALTEQMTVDEKLNLIVETSQAVERLGIPKYYHGNEALHGVVRPGEFTVFPQAIAFGAMFDDELLENGSALSIPWLDENAAAILECWYPGEQGGNAIADILFGKVSPSGRLPLSFPKHTEDLPPFDDYEMTNGRTYMYNKIPPLYPFGFGLSYTSFAYSDISVTQELAQVTVTNIGNFEADEVAQLYIDSAGLENQPKYRLKGLQRMHLKPSESKRISFPLNDESFSLFDDAGKRTVCHGKYTVYIDGHLPDRNSCCFVCNILKAE